MKSLKKETKLKERLADQLEIPMELLTIRPVVKWMEDQLVVENVKKIILFDTKEIILEYADGKLYIYGSKLKIPYMAKDLIVVQGKIQTVSRGDLVDTT